MKIKWDYFKTILRHKKYVFIECAKCGIFWQGVKHDLSKFSKEEFEASAMFYANGKYGEKTDEIKRAYSQAWLHHKGVNPHHWEWWIDFGKRGEIVVNKIPYKYVVEMVCDWVGAGRVYEKEEWKQDAPLNYYNKVRDGRYFDPDTEVLIMRFLTCIKDKGLDEFHKMAKNKTIKKSYEN